MTTPCQSGDSRFPIPYSLFPISRNPGLAYRLAGEDELARDFTQETFIRAFQRLKDFRSDSSFGTWIHTIAMSVSLNGLRKVKRFRTREASLDDALTVGVTTR